MIHLARTFREHPEIRYGVTTMCIGLGMGGTVIWENAASPSEEGRPPSDVPRRADDTRARAQDAGGEQ
jgi:acetyl-CoA acyltransferase